MHFPPAPCLFLIVFFQRTWSKSSSFKPTSFRVFRPVLKEQQLWDRGHQSDQRFNVKKKTGKLRRFAVPLSSKGTARLTKNHPQRKRHTLFDSPPFGIAKIERRDTQVPASISLPSCDEDTSKLASPSTHEFIFFKLCPQRKMDIHLAQSPPELGKTQPATP